MKKAVFFFLLTLMSCNEGNQVPCIDIPFPVISFGFQPNPVFDFLVENGNLYIGTRYDGIHIVDPTTMKTIDYYNDDDLYGIEALLCFGGYLYAAAYQADTYVVLTPGLEKVTTIDAQGASYCYVHNGFLYLLHYNAASLSIYDNSDPASPRHISTTKIPRMKSPSGIWTDGKTAVITGYDSDNVHKLDVTEKEAPRFIRRIDNFGDGVGVLNGAYSVQVAGGVAFVSSYYSDTFTAIDLDSFDVLSTVSTGRGAAYFKIIGSTAYVATNEGVAQINICDPAAMFAEEMHHTGKIMADVEFFDGRLLTVEYHGK